MMRPMDMTNVQIEIPYLLKIGAGKTERVGKYLYDKNMMRIALYLGDGIAEIVGPKLFAGFIQYGINTVHQQIVTTVDIDEITHSAFSLSGVDAIVGVGGGKALDFAKYTAHLLRLPFISIPTSMSNDGFGSSGASITVQGNRKSVKAASPFGIVIDLDVIKGSPDVFMFSGVGDMLSKITALHDWRAAREKGLERYVDFSSLMAYNSMDILFLKHCFDIRDENFQRSLCTSLMFSGLAMEIAGSSRPASGSEHLISHALDEISAKPKMHGIQVGIATYLCALLQKNDKTDDIRIVLENTGLLDFVKQDPFVHDEFIAAIKLAPGIKNNFYTILSEPESLERAMAYIQTDPLLQSVIR